MTTKYIFVTGGVVSSLGKGIAAASLGRLLVERGLNVTIQKFDPYIKLLAAYRKEGQSITWRENTHKMAEANKLFAHYAW